MFSTPPPFARMDSRASHYERFFLKNDVLVGAVLINRFQDKPHLVKLIEGCLNLAAYREKLEDPNFDIRGIPLI